MTNLTTADMTSSQKITHKALFNEIQEYVSYDEAFDLSSLSVLRAFEMHKSESEIMYATCNRVIPFESRFSDGLCMFNNVRCAILEMDFHCTSGTDALVVYLYESEQQVLDHGVRIDIEDKAEGFKAYDRGEKLNEGFLAIERANPEKFLYVCQEEKGYLVPETAECAKKMFDSQMEDLQNSLAWPSSEWLEEVNKPYMFAKMGKVTANCAALMGGI